MFPDLIVEGDVSGIIYNVNLYSYGFFLRSSTQSICDSVLRSFYPGKIGADVLNVVEPSVLSSRDGLLLQKPLQGFLVRLDYHLLPMYIRSEDTETVDEGKQLSVVR